MSETYAPTGAGAGTITYSDSTHSNVPITFSNLSPMTDTVPSPTFIFTAPAAATTRSTSSTARSSAAPQTDQINDGGTGTFELINFANKTAVTANVHNSRRHDHPQYHHAGRRPDRVERLLGRRRQRNGRRAGHPGRHHHDDRHRQRRRQHDQRRPGRLAGRHQRPGLRPVHGRDQCARIDDSAEPTAADLHDRRLAVTATSMPSTISFSGGGITTLDLRAQRRFHRHLPSRFSPT